MNIMGITPISCFLGPRWKFVDVLETSEQIQLPWDVFLHRHGEQEIVFLFYSCCDVTLTFFQHHLYNVLSCKSFDDDTMTSMNIMLYSTHKDLTTGIYTRFE